MFIENCAFVSQIVFFHCYNQGLGAVDEWFKSHAWKACVG